MFECAVKSQKPFWIDLRHHKKKIGRQDSSSCKSHVDRFGLCPTRQQAAHIAIGCPRYLEERDLTRVFASFQLVLIVFFLFCLVLLLPWTYNNSVAMCTAGKVCRYGCSVPDPSEVFLTRRGGATDPHTRLPGYTCSTMLGVTQVSLNFDT